MNIELFGRTYDVCYRHPTCSINGISLKKSDEELARIFPALWERFVLSGYSDIHRFVLNHAWHSWIKQQQQHGITHNFIPENFSILCQKGTFFLRYQSSFYTCDIGLPNPTLYTIAPNFYVLKKYSDQHMEPIWDRYHCYALSAFFQRLPLWYGLVGRHWHPDAYTLLTKKYMTHPWDESYAVLLNQVLKEESVVSVYVLHRAMDCVAKLIAHGVTIHDLER